MFSDKTFTPVNIPSCWQTLKTLEENETQTTELVGVDKELQTTNTNDKEIQTDVPEQNSITPSVDEDALAAFLTKVCPEVLRELDKASRSKAFLSYASPEDDRSNEAKNSFNLLKPKCQVENDFKVNCLTWSCTGSVVVMGLGSANHHNWCSHSGFIHFYNINRSTSISMTPSKILEATSCVTTLATHPFEPFILASGLYRGNIVLWNLQQEGAECIATVAGHNDVVTNICWTSGQLSRPLLVSSGLDGQMSVWSASHLSETLTLNERYMLGNEANASLEAGITCFSFSPCSPHVFVAALEGGKLLYCSISNTTPTNRVNADVPLNNPVIGELEGHKGLITSVAFSPYHDDTFITVGTDQEIHVYSLKEVAPLKVIWSEIELLGLAWSPSQANIFIAWGLTEEIIVYDSHKGSKLTLLKTDAIPSICCSSFNWKSPKLLAVGDATGKGHVWQIPQYFATS